MPEDAIAIFAGKSVDTILADGGTQSWLLDPGRARRCQYVVLCRNTKPRYYSDSDEPHGAGFMVGRVANVVPSTQPQCPDRWLVLFSEYAVVSIPNVWGGWRNPVRYTTLADLGIDPDNLEFRPMPERQPVEEVAAAAAPSQIAGLTIPEAKSALAATYGVAPEAIEITIRG